MSRRYSLRRHHLLIAGWVAAALVLIAACGQAAPTPSPEQVAKLAALCTASDTVRCYPAPNQQWMVKLDLAAGSAQLLPLEGAAQPLLDPAAKLTGASWSADSRKLALAQAGIGGPARLWQITFDGQEGSQKALAPTAIYTSTATTGAGAGQTANGNAGLVFGDWSPNGRYLLFWEDPLLSASILADGTPLHVVDTLTGAAHLVTPGGPLGPDTVALTNPGYHSWAPDSSHLVITLGGYRSAQEGKALALHRSGTEGSTVVISSSEQIPGMVAWSPKGDLIAYAAISATDVTSDAIDNGSIDNPAIAARRIYLYDPQNGKKGRLDPNTESFQDAPVWSHNGSLVYYIQREGDQVVVMVADLYAGTYSKLPGASMPISDVQSYYGQFDWSPLLSKITP